MEYLNSERMPVDNSRSIRLAVRHYVTGSHITACHARRRLAKMVPCAEERARLIREFRERSYGV